MSTAAQERKPQRRSAETRERLVTAAIEVFADRGFEGASTRDIASRAGVAQSALPYHFTTKEALWQAASERIFGVFAERFSARLEGLDGVDATQRARLLLGDFIRFAAEHPEMHRFMLLEGTRDSDRLRWLVDRQIRPIVESVRAVFDGLDSESRAWTGDFSHFYYLLIGAVATPYALAAEFRLLMGADPSEPELVEAHIDALVALVFPDRAEEKR